MQFQRGIVERSVGNNPEPFDKFLTGWESDLFGPLLGLDNFLIFPLECLCAPVVTFQVYRESICFRIYGHEGNKIFVPVKRTERPMMEQINL